MHRRVETLDVISAEVVRRQVSVDFALPGPLRAALSVGEGQCVVPLAVLGKQILRHFDLRDAAEEAVPVVARDHTALLAGAALLAQAADAVPGLRPELAGRLLAVVQAPDAVTGRERLVALESGAGDDPEVAAAAGARADGRPAGRPRRELPAARRARRDGPPAGGQVPLRLLPLRTAGMARRRRDRSARHPPQRAVGRARLALPRRGRAARGAALRAGRAARRGGGRGLRRRPRRRSRGALRRRRPARRTADGGGRHPPAAPRPARLRRSAWPASCRPSSPPGWRRGSCGRPSPGRRSRSCWPRRRCSRGPWCARASTAWCRSCSPGRAGRSSSPASPPSPRPRPWRSSSRPPSGCGAWPCGFSVLATVILALFALRSRPSLRSSEYPEGGS